MASAPLPDGSHDAVVVDAEDTPDGGVLVHLVVLGGAHKGEVVEVRGPADIPALDLLGVPATLTVDDGVPLLRLEP